jgi:competence ComEA-like helix-hairpin-helix protein
MIRNLWMSSVVTMVMVAIASIAVGPVRAEQAAAGDAKVAQVNLNLATAAEIEKLPGVGPAMAARIVEYRQKNGGFKKVEEIIENSRSARSLLRISPTDPCVRDA